MSVVLLLLMCMALTASTAVPSTEYHVYEEISEVFSGINRTPPVKGNWVKCEWPLDIKDCMEKMEAKEGRKMISEAQKKINTMLMEGSDMLPKKDAGDMLRMKSQVEEWKKLAKDAARGIKTVEKEIKQLLERKVERTGEKKLEAERLRDTSALEKTLQENVFQRKMTTTGNQDIEKIRREIVKKKMSRGTSWRKWLR